MLESAGGPLWGQNSWHYHCNLHQLWAVEGDNIPKHLDQLWQYYLHINLTADPDFKISDAQFKVIISSSFPQSWDAFTEDYVGQRTDVKETNPKKLMPSQQFIGIIHEEYLWHNGHANDESINIVTHKPHSALPKLNLTQCITNGCKWCSYCKHNNHNDTDCHHLNNTPPCNFCNLKGHLQKNCWKKKKKEMRESNGEKQRAEVQRCGDTKRQKKDVANMVEEPTTGVEDILLFMWEELQL